MVSEKDKVIRILFLLSDKVFGSFYIQISLTYPCSCFSYRICIQGLDLLYGLIFLSDRLLCMLCCSAVGLVEV